MQFRFCAMAAAALAALAFAASAERSDRSKEIVVGADRLTADESSKTSTFEGDVVISQGTMRMTASKVTVREDKDRHKYYVANGAPVTFRQKRDNVDEWIEGFAQRAEFDDRNDVLKLYDRARVKRNNDELTGDVITYDMKKDVAEVSGAPASSKAPTRIKMIMTPRKADEKAAPNPPLNLKPDSGQQ